MLVLRRLALLASIGVGAAVLAGPAFGAFARPGGLPNTVATPHFLVHYGSDPASNAKITQTQAGDVAALAERAYAAELADGYGTPLSDGALGGDSRIDIYVADLSASPGVLGLTEWDADLPQTSAFIVLAGNAPEQALDQHTIAHELFHVLQMSVWLPSSTSDYWLLEGSAEWMGYRTNAYRGDHAFDFGPTDMALDCRDPISGHVMCDLSDTYKNNGYSRWPFFEYTTELYGTSFVNDVFAQGAAGAPNAITALANALTAKGTTLADAYNSWTAVDLASLYTVPALQGRTPTRYGGAIATGAKTGTLATTKVPVNHLSTRILEFDRGDGDDSHACFAATLSLTVTIPAGTLSKPVFWWNAAGNTPIPLSVNGNTAVAALPWDTCKWPSTNAGYLALPNASQNVDAADFSVSGALNVDTSQPTSASAPPAPVSTDPSVVAVSNLEVAPFVDVAGSEVLRLGAGQRVIRLLVESSGEGKLHATLGGVDLGSPTLRAGNNVVRLTLPVSALSALRRTAAANGLLTLTAISPLGTQTGASVTRHVAVAKPAKKKHGK
jgi:hypothetical protein